MHVCSLIGSTPLNCTGAAENYLPDEVECIRKYRKMTGRKESMACSYVFQCCKIQWASITNEEGKKNKKQVLPYPIWGSLILPQSNRWSISQQFRTMVSFLTPYIFRWVSIAPVLQELGCSLSFLGYFVWLVVHIQLGCEKEWVR